MQRFLIVFTALAAVVQPSAASAAAATGAIAYVRGG
jgi:hypothetical protein